MILQSAILEIDSFITNPDSNPDAWRFLLQQQSAQLSFYLSIVLFHLVPLFDMYIFIVLDFAGMYLARAVFAADV